MKQPPPETPDEILVVAAILGDLKAFDELAIRYRPAVVRLARQIVGSNHAEDITQDALLLAFRQLPSIDEPARFGSWLMVITRHRALRFLRDDKSDRMVRFDLDHFLIDTLAVMQQPSFEKRAAEEELQQALDRLPEDYSLALRLRFFDEMPLKRMANFLDVPLSTVKWRLHHGKTLLLEEVKRLDISLS